MVITFTKRSEYVIVLVHAMFKFKSALVVLTSYRIVRTSNKYGMRRIWFDHKRGEGRHLEIFLMLCHNIPFSSAGL